jgi:2-polyprenyl-3-methyl-5-hydroxy-6-metoxy-1,4-benzoquinol methylase
MSESKQEPSYRGRVKYTPKGARKYQVRRPHKDRAELKLVEHAFRIIPKGTVLDAPCGGGRVSMLLEEHGYQVTAGDLSESMVQIANEKLTAANLKARAQREDLERMSFPDRHFDAVICFRLFHHFPNAEIRQRVIDELCRVSRGHVALSYFSPASYTSLQRRWRAATGGRITDKHATPLNEIRKYFAKAGFRLVKDFAQLRFIHTLHLAVFRRDD